MVMFIPVGILTGRLWKWKGLWVAVRMSAVIEALQLVSERGLCEFDDILHNSFGTLICVGIVMPIKQMTRCSAK